MCLHLSCEEHQHLKELHTSNKLGRRNKTVFIFNLCSLLWRKKILTRKQLQTGKLTSKPNPKANKQTKSSKNSIVPAVESD